MLAHKAQSGRQTLGGLRRARSHHVGSRSGFAEASVRQKSEWEGFLDVPRVKFTLKIISYFCFLGLYLLVLYQRGGRPQIEAPPAAPDSRPDASLPPAATAATTTTATTSTHTLTLMPTLTLALAAAVAPRLGLLRLGLRVVDRGDPPVVPRHPARCTARLRSGRALALPPPPPSAWLPSLLSPSGRGAFTQRTSRHARVDGRVRVTDP